MSPEFVSVLETYGELILLIAAIASVFYGFYRWSSRQLADKIAAQIKDATRQIAPGANGGESLADVARMAKEMHGNQTEIMAQLARMEERLDHSDGRQEKFMRETRKTLGVWHRTLRLQGIEIPIEEAS